METPAPTRSKYVSIDRVTGSNLRVISATKQVIALIAQGEPLKRSIDALGLTMDLFHSCVSGERELSQAYARAQEMRADILVEEAIAAADSDIDPAKARNMMTVRQWAASKYHSKKFGDRIDLNVTQMLDISGTLLEARQRMLRPVSDQQLIEDAQVIDLQGFARGGPTDNQSITSVEPDIFAPIPYIRNEIAVVDGSEPGIFASPARIENAPSSGEEEIDIFS